MNEDHPPEIGERIGSYSVRHRLAARGAADVYLATLDADSPAVVLKVFRSGTGGRCSLNEHDIGVVSALAHPHVLPVLEYDVSSARARLAGKRMRARKKSART